MSILPNSIESVDHLAVFDQVAEERFNALEVEVVMTFLMNILPATAIGTMATDLSVNGVGGLAQATTEAERRQVLLDSIATRKKIGTPGAIKRAVQTLGYSEPELIEGYGDAPVIHNGDNLHNGAIYHNGGNNGWAQFVVILPESELTPLTSAQIDELVQYVNHYKNARSKLVGIGYYDSVIPIHDGQFTHDGTADHSGTPANTIIFVT
jgi:hypothetical protein